MSKYRELRLNPPKLTIKKDAKEIMFHMVSVMCDNKSLIRLRKDGNGEFKLNGMGQSLSNFQWKHQPYEIEWEADLGEWGGVIAMINSGTEVIESVASR